jgi:hypothetical protein
VPDKEKEKTGQKMPNTIECAAGEFTRSPGGTDRAGLLPVLSWIKNEQ